MDNDKIECPLCVGAGTIPAPGLGKSKKYLRKAKEIQLLRDDGYSIREIMKLLGYSSTSAVAHYLKK